MSNLRAVQIRTKNFTARPLRRSIFVPFQAVARLGSRTPTNECFTVGRVVECNTVDSIENSRSKLRMKKCFSSYGVKQAEYYHGIMNPTTIENFFRTYPLVGKSITGFQGKGMVLINNREELNTFCRTHSPDHFFIEKFYNYGREYRIHATRDKGFLAWRKLRRRDATEKWFFNSHNCNWVGEDHELFDKPINWKQLCKVAASAIRSCGLDIGAVDIRIQDSIDMPDYIVCEVNSAPALGDDGVEMYKEKIKEILINKFNQR